MKAAAEEAVPGATVKKSGHDRADGYFAMLLKADGETRVLVHLDKDFKVTKVVDPAPKRRPHGHPHKAHHGPRADAKANANADTASA